MNVTKKRFQAAFFAVVLLLAAVRLLFPQVYSSPTATAAVAAPAPTPTATGNGRAATDDRFRPHPIRSVPNYQAAFPDSQSVQIVAATQWGVTPVKNRHDAEERKRELVYVGTSPYYHVDPLSSSIPYLVPRAAVLLHDIGQAFYDSLYVKGIAMNQLIVTSVLRSMDDVARLRQHNGNATEQSCHLYGTTFDICYNRYHALSTEVRNDTLKWVLAEVLRDKRDESRCYIKYEVKQGCFHITTR